MDPILPLSDMQQSMLVHEALGDRPMYAMPLCFRITGELDTGRLEQALHHVIRRHPVLCATYDDAHAVPLPSTAPLPALRTATDGSGGPGDAHMPAELAELWEVPFDLYEEPPVRAGVISRSATEHWFALAVHHVAGDSWSLSLMVREIGLAYAALARGGPAGPADEASGFFADAAAEQDRDHDRDNAWWRGRLAGVQPQPYPRRTPPCEDERGAFLALPLGLGAAETQGIRGLARSTRVSPAVVLFTAVSAAVAAGGPPYDTTVGMPAARRDTEELQAAMGPLLNTLPVRTTWTDPMSPAAVVLRHAEAIEESLAHKELPYSRILRAAGIQRLPGGDPLFLHLVNIDTEVPRLPLPGLRTSTVPIPPRWANFPALWEFGWGSVGNIHGTLRASADAFTEADAQHLRQGFQSTLRRLLDADRT
ncbi:Chondramide synthase cmdD [Streptomyces lavendulae subsp. lavendulae]|uniref:Chondramide synthase cmdD n=1 Tax=Streptomyces lavendulae subsp. lavendulae TaxID=58340 RepID=A0A2K8P5M5_STRLA|nr:condensation domain-containing protein [Streptomyces lavendulae]ATZ22051.1 Chondramide synthase cmdD [Streptomyces lavendulae subsp. lavendulae]ATZ29520.1 Chondramide synthase cmdD [Streptomyces lavendulae subsp. lavendulae]